MNRADKEHVPPRDLYPNWQYNPTILTAQGPEAFIDITNVDYIYVGITLEHPPRPKANTVYPINIPGPITSRRAFTVKAEKPSHKNVRSK